MRKKTIICSDWPSLFCIKWAVKLLLTSNYVFNRYKAESLRLRDQIEENTHLAESLRFELSVYEHIHTKGR